jgi:hypothetical protein
MEDNFQHQLQYGIEGEKEVAEIFINNGYAILPMFQFKHLTESPKIIGPSTNNIELISPDLIVFKNNKTLFVEVKKKTRWVMNNNNLETGFDYRLYRHYLDVVNRTGIDLIIVFNHVNKPPLGMYYVNIKTEGRMWNGKIKDNYVYKQMYFFNFKDLKKLI